MSTIIPIGPFHPVLEEPEYIQLYVDGDIRSPAVLKEMEKQAVIRALAARREELEDVELCHALLLGELHVRPELDEDGDAVGLQIFLPLQADLPVRAHHDVLGVGEDDVGLIGIDVRTMACPIALLLQTGRR